MSSDSPPPSSSTLDTVRKTTEAIATFVQWLAQLIQRRNWFTLLALIDAVLILFFNPSIISQLLDTFFKQKLPAQYPAFFGFAVAGIFITALTIAVRTMPRPQAEAVDFRERKAIKGLRPFGSEDAEIFTRLQRNRSLQDCFEKITESEFRFGILVGESGCGKHHFYRRVFVLN